MSSILDALRKLESEKAATAPPVQVDLRDAIAHRGPYLLPNPPNRRRVVLEITPLAASLATLAAVAFCASAAGIAYLLVSQNANSEVPPVAAALPSAEPFASAQPAPEAPAAADTRAPEPAAAAPEEPAPRWNVDAPQFVFERPSAPVDVVVPESRPPTTRASAPAAPPAPAASTAPRSSGALPSAAELRRLPELSESQRLAMGLPEITINVITEHALALNPPRAMINWHRVAVGEEIPKTEAVLIGIDQTGIGIEAGGKRFRISK